MIIDVDTHWELARYPKGALDVLAALPDRVVFSSDYPHQEGNAEPIALYSERLKSFDAKTRTRFMGGNASEWFDRMGAPLGPEV